jgi:hypothetical protein
VKGSEREQRGDVLVTSTFEQYHVPVYEGSLAEQSFVDNENPVEPARCNGR